MKGLLSLWQLTEPWALGRKPGWKGEQRNWALSPAACNKHPSLSTGNTSHFSMLFSCSIAKNIWVKFLISSEQALIHGRKLWGYIPRAVRSLLTWILYFFPKHLLLVSAKAWTPETPNPLLWPEYGSHVLTYCPSGKEELKLKHMGWDFIQVKRPSWQPMPCSISQIRH